jgi:hypothetical protein
MAAPMPTNEQCIDGKHYIMDGDRAVNVGACEDVHDAQPSQAHQEASQAAQGAQGLLGKLGGLMGAGNTPAQAQGPMPGGPGSPAVDPNAAAQMQAGAAQPGWQSLKKALQGGQQ